MPMRKIISTHALLLCFVVTVFSQTSLTYKNHAIVAGTSHHFYMAQKADEGPSGPNQTWNFSEFKKESELTSQMLSTSETDKGAILSDANAIIREFSNDFYFKVTKNAIEEYGYSNGNTIIKYDQPLVKIKFPFSYGNVQQGSFNGTDINNPSVKLSGTYKIEADAYGKLILPDNIVYKNVLRLKSTRIDGNCTCTLVTYRWYSSDVRYPLLTIIKSENGGTSNALLTAYYADGSTLKKDATEEPNNSLAGDYKLAVSPNPFEDNVTVTYQLSKASNVKLEIVDNNGKPVQTLVAQKKEQGNYTITFSAKQLGLSQGAYFVRGTFNEKVLTEKIIKSN